MIHPFALNSNIFIDKSEGRAVYLIGDSEPAAQGCDECGFTCPHIARQGKYPSASCQPDYGLCNCIKLFRSAARKGMNPECFHH